MVLPALVALIVATAAATARADVTGLTGGGMPFSNIQPSLVVTDGILTSGLFPSQSGGSPSGDTLGFIYNFAGNFAPRGSVPTAGQLLPISQNTALFSVIGTLYGGNGMTTFALPNLQGTAMLGQGPENPLGGTTGSPIVTLSTAQIPPHDHTLAGGGATGTTGGGQPFSNMQPSLGLTPLIAVNGSYPSQSGPAGFPFLGEIATFAGDFAPSGWMPANGQLLPINQNQALFSILGTTYGGNGMTTFALPDLRGRVAVGADTSHPLGSAFGEPSTTITVSQLAPHNHTLPGGGVTGTTGGGQPVNNDQPSLALTYVIALNGIYPSQDVSSFSDNVPVLGEIVPFAGNYAPAGWALANGQLLPINQNEALFSILGTTYGGDGVTTFALPDLQGRTLLGEDGSLYPLGDALGADTTILTVDNLPSHDHDIPGAVPEPTSIALFVIGLLGLGAARVRVQSVG
jgi:microcystin-dependent protein